MKERAPRIHLLDVAEPLLGFHGLIVRCGIELRNAKPKFQIIEELSENFFLPLTTCTKCRTLVPIGEDKRHYLYGLIEAQAGQDAEAEEAA